MGNVFFVGVDNAHVTNQEVKKKYNKVAATLESVGFSITFIEFDGENPSGFVADLVDVQRFAEYVGLKDSFKFLGALPAGRRYFSVSASSARSMLLAYINKPTTESSFYVAFDGVALKEVGLLDDYMNEFYAEAEIMVGELESFAVSFLQQLSEEHHG